MSWMSPFTVATTMGPFFSPETPCFSMAVFTSSKAAWAAAALCSSWGRKQVPFSKASPTWSSAGISTPFTSSWGSVVSSASRAASPAWAFRPRITASFRSTGAPGWAAVCTGAAV